MRNVSAVVGGIAGVQNFAVVGGFDADLALLDGEKLAGALKMCGTAKGAPRFELDFVEFDIFFEVQRRKCANLAVCVGAIMVGVVIGPNHCNG